MFCCKCGARLDPGALQCSNCGDVLPEFGLRNSPTADVTQNSVQDSVRGGSTKCHKCGSPDKVHSWEFGLGRATSSSRSWSGTALSAALSAITVPLTGFGVLQLPGKKTTFSVLRLRLTLCDSCWRNREGYSCHPLWAEAQRLGFTEFFCAGDLARLEPVPRA